MAAEVTPKSVFGWSGSLADAWALGFRLSWVYTLMVIAIAVLAGLRAHLDHPPRRRDRGRHMVRPARPRRPAQPLRAAAVLIPVFWGLSLRAAIAQSRRSVILIIALWIALHLMMPDPTPGVIAVLTRPTGRAAGR